MSDAEERWAKLHDNGTWLVVVEKITGPILARCFDEPTADLIVAEHNARLQPASPEPADPGPPFEPESLKRFARVWVSTRV